jgi:hypothetical protein
LPSCSYRCANGEIHNGMVVAAFALTDVNPGDGGFCAVPGRVGVYHISLTLSCAVKTPLDDSRMAHV